MHFFSEHLIGTKSALYRNNVKKTRFLQCLGFSFVTLYSRERQDAVFTQIRLQSQSRGLIREGGVI